MGSGRGGGVPASPRPWKAVPTPVAASANAWGALWRTAVGLGELATRAAVGRALLLSARQSAPHALPPSTLPGLEPATRVLQATRHRGQRQPEQLPLCSVSDV